MTVRVDNYSRLGFADLLLQDGYEFWGPVFLTEIEPQSDDTSYTVRSGDRIDRLAFEFYGDPILWWVLAVANGLELLPSDLSEGQVLRVPSSRYVTQELMLLDRT